jgi:Tc toxin complex TcA C-terminal TcB-binding domain/Neuraminidase-like domain
MKKESNPPATAGNHYIVEGIVLNQHQQPVPGISIRAYNKTIRSKHLLGETVTDEAGKYTINYTLKNAATAAVVICVYDSDKTLLNESRPQHNITEQLRVNMDIHSKLLTAISVYEQLVNTVASFTEQLPLQELTENETHRDISFIAQKTGLQQEHIEELAMAARFEAHSSIPADIWFALLHKNPQLVQQNSMLAISADNSFESRQDAILETLMHSPVAILMNSIENAIAENIIPGSTTAELPKIHKRLDAFMQAHAKEHPVTGTPSVLYQKAALGGLKGKELESFMEVHNGHTGSEESFWEQVSNNTGLANNKAIEKTQAVFQLSQLTGNNLALTERIINTEKIKSPADIKKLAAYSSSDWEALIAEHETQPIAATARSKKQPDEKKQLAAQLEQSFTVAFPTAAFSARLKKDTASKLPHRDKIGKFLQEHDHFDLLHGHVGKFMQENPNAVSETEALELTSHLRRVQRVFKLAPKYETTHLLLNDNIHSAHQVHKMGEDNFVTAYGEKLGEQEAKQIFNKASEVHANAVALIGNLKSMSDASAMNAFPDFGAALIQQLSHELPNLDKLFGHTDFCECSECSSVYGAPAYLTDILHFLDKRTSLLPATPSSIGDKVPTIKDMLLRRRPDIGDIDLECNNTNIEIPYIDIACETMEDYIAAPVVSVANTFLPKLVKGTIDATLLAELTRLFNASGQTNISSLLTANATISAPYITDRLQTNNTFLQQNNWVIRDSLVALRVTNITGAATFECRLLHQTLLSSEAIGAGPEYINTNVYNNFLKTAKRPFTLPFDLFETEGKWYLEKQGIQKTDLINTFRKEDKLAPGASPTDLLIAYTSLGINEAEQTLIFVTDPTRQSLYWGTAAIATGIQIDVFEQLTGLNYTQIVSLLGCRFINPLRDSVIEHDDLSCDITKQRIIKITPTKLDAIHRFLRLWRKTTFTISELDVVIMSAHGKGKIDTAFAWQLYQFTLLQQLLQLDIFQLMAFYDFLDINSYNQLFQNNEITNPVDPDFSFQTALAGILPLQEKHKPVVAAALRISLNEVNALFAKTVPRISIGSLSFINRNVQLSRVLGITITDFLTFLNLVDANPFLNPLSTCLFIKKYKLLQSSGFNADELNYVLRHQDNISQSFIPSGSQVSAALSKLQDELLAVRAATTPAVDPNGVLLSKWLSDPVFKWDISLVNKLVDILNTANDDEYRQKIVDNSNFLLNLRMAYREPVFTTALSVLPLAPDGAPITFPPSIAAQLSFDAEKKQLRLVGYMSQANLDALLALCTVTGTQTGGQPPALALIPVPPTDSDICMAYQVAVISLFNRAQQVDSSAANIFFATQAEVDANLKTLLNNRTTDRFALFINKLATVYRKLKQPDILVKNICTWFKADKKMAVQLLASVPSISDDFTADNFVNKTGDTNAPAAAYPLQFARYHFLAKTFFIAGKLKLTDTDIAFLLANAANINTLNFLTLPLQPVTTAVTTFPGFENMVNLLRFQQYYPAKITDSITNTAVSIYTILQSVFGKTVLTPAELVTLKANLVLLTGWKATDLDVLITTPNLLTLVLPGDIKSITVLLRLHQCFSILKQLDISATDAVSWCKASLIFADSSKIKQTLKSKYSNSDWLAVSKPLQDRLREKKRDALIAYLLTNPGTQTWKDANDLYSYFLLDVEMSCCQPTSRIVQATNSVQLFVQRCFLRLEDSIIVNSKTDANWLQWKWMKNFRVWQANVKVFLYPENWIEPELLPNEIKSPFLKELESELLQHEVTAVHAEDAFQNYLQKLDGVARLEMKGMFYDFATKTLHVFGRTYGGDPKIYYYRRFIDNRRWTPWTKVDLDINSDHIVPVVYNNRVYLFWAIFTEQADNPAGPIVIPRANPTTGETSIPMTSPSKSWQIQLAFSEFKDGKWTPKKMSDKDTSEQITCAQSSFPFRPSFVFTHLDIPLFNYDGIFNASGTPVDTPAVFNQKAVNASLQNGTLIINCYYHSNVTSENSFSNYAHIGSFQLDPVKGYPVQTFTPYSILPQFRSGIGTAFGSARMYNMLESENRHRHRPSNNYTTPDRSKGNFRNQVSIQMGFIEKVVYLQRIYQTGNNPVNDINKIELGKPLPYFYQDNYRSYFAIPEMTNNGALELPFTGFMEYWVIFFTQGFEAAQAYFTAKYGVQLFSLLEMRHYYNFHHPLVDDFRRQLFTKGIDGLMERDTQLKGDIAYDPAPDKFNFKNYYNPGAEVYSGSAAPVTYPNGVVDAFPGYPKEDVDFSLQSGYGLYNWELFFHAPLMIAERLSQNQQFEDANRWYNYIFNPMDTSDKPSPDKYWNTKPFFINTNNKYTKQRIENVLKGINGGEQDLLQNVTDWRNNPFQPHYIAQYRTVAYQKTAVMKYVGHLIRHGDYLFNRHTMESVNEATQLYILAAEILGPKPQVIPQAAKPVVDNYFQLEKKLDAMSDAMIDVENLMPFHSVKGYTGTVPNTPTLPNLQTLYFCIPMNENMVGPTGHWDVVADRLFKIRHCLNIDGTLAPLSLFSPAIDPGMLVRAAAAGLDIGAILNDVNAPLPIYRFMIMMQKAYELCNEVKSLGGAMLSALEKKDAETMSLLRSGHEIKMLGAVLSLKQKQIEESQTAFDNLVKQKALITIRQQYYAGLIKDGLSSGEKNALDLNKLSFVAEGAVALGYVLAGGLKFIPQFVLGASGLGSPVVTASTGGEQAGGSAEAATRTLSAIATASDKLASIIGTQSGYNRRNDEWQHQLNLANKELEQIEKQLLGAQIRLDIATLDKANQQLQIDQSKEANDLMRSKFTNEELFSWMVTQISATYFKSYQLAYDVAKQTERCFRYELGLADSAYINFGYWDSLKKGLLAGEYLSYDIKKMEMAYFEQNKRELELTKPISLSLLDPVALLKLKTTGDCWVNLPEELFDMDYPGHYMRRIKSVSITIPCISGPYTTVSCKLTMTNNSIRTSSTAGGQYSRKLSNGVPADDLRFRDGIGALQSIATSSAQNDSGLFEMNFRDERYLPFEGAGAISLWHIQLPAAIKQFDYNTISDVIIHLKYTARDGGELLKANATTSLNTKINEMLVSLQDRGLMRIFSAKNDLPTDWYKFLHPANATDDQVLTLNLDKTRFPLFVQGKIIKITSVELVADSTATPINNIQVIPAGVPTPLNLTATGAYGSWLNGTVNYSAGKKDPGAWVIKNPVANVRLTENTINNLVIIVHYEIS